MVTAGGGGGGGEKKEEGFGFIGGGSMKDWLIIMVVVVVGLMFLTHATGVPGQKGPNGGFAAFAATGQLIGSLMQWATFLLANPGIIAFAFLCRSKTFRKVFPLGLIHPDLGITGFCNRFENLGEYSLWGLIKNPGKTTRLQALAADIAENKKDLVDKALKDSKLMKDPNAKLLLSAVDNVGNLTPEMANATSISEWNKALKAALDEKKGVITDPTMKQQLTDLSEYLDKDAGKALMANPKIINAVSSIRVFNSTKQLTKGWGTLQATIGRAGEGGLKIDTADKMLAFFAENPYNLIGVHTAMNVSRLEGTVDSKWKSIIGVATQDGDPVKMARAQLRTAFKGAGDEVVNAMADAVGSLTKEQLSGGRMIIDDLLQTDAVKSNRTLEKALNDLANTLKSEESEAGAAARKGLGELGDLAGREISEAAGKLLKKEI